MPYKKVIYQSIIRNLLTTLNLKELKLLTYLSMLPAGIDVDIDVEHEGKRTKVMTPNPTPSRSGGHPGARSDNGTGGSEGAGANEGDMEVDELSSLGSASGLAKV